ncbi:type IV toxin-antitoxin system YeeU family antitoxin [Serratia sp. JSRIV001]|uniref:type IV toxin-antitoxin system YeeU family antitoxin n=1 Tax=unclassified Serratia (in: enterobacteria) TaxID=2647522 RepID=UPI001CBB5D98|nr:MULTISPECIES: type IV toxin-antitoxin system YeeU family antitoxin [unclassified Serratia (in: enterobacteria)]UAN45249.1 type IV toxin-antitoxin system YeeU family antitoxin [Serratia sp. JSRIV001]UAN50723.1 type IV toxin-antitoxin system YeeU family antitoxin [Serratia sp. JSRIV002]UAN56689.1 type IV toxin-antitoxin system YeeU family antitoxin [Serratia sp. JSRIV004]
MKEPVLNTDNNAAPLTDEDNIPSPVWGLHCAITPRLGARLVQKGNRLHFLPDRAGFVGMFSPDALKTLDRAFPVLIKLLEACLRSGELDQRRQHCVTVQHAGFTCEADTLGSFGHVYLAVYQTPT